MPEDAGDKGRVQREHGSTPQGRSPSEVAKPVRRVVAGKQLIIIPGTGVIEHGQDVKEDDKRSTEDNKNLKDINKSLKKAGKKDGKGGKEGSRGSRFAENLAKQTGRGVKEAVQPLVDVFNPMTYLKMFMDLPVISQLDEAWKASKGPEKGKETGEKEKEKDKKEREEQSDDKREENQTETGHQILEHGEDNTESLGSIDNNFVKLLSLTESIKETLQSLLNQSLDSKLINKEKMNEFRRGGGGVGGLAGGLGGGAGLGGLGGLGGGPGGGGPGGGGLGGGAGGWMTKLAGLWLGKDVLRSWARKKWLGGANVVKTMFTRTLRAVTFGKLFPKAPLKGIEGIATKLRARKLAANLVTKTPAERIAAQMATKHMMPGRTNFLDHLWNPKKQAAKVAEATVDSAQVMGRAEKLTKSYRAGKALRVGAQVSSKVARRAMMASGGPVTWVAEGVITAGEIGVEHYINRLQAKTAGQEAALGKGTFIEEGVKYDAETGMPLAEKGYWDKVVQGQGLDPAGVKAGMFRRRESGKLALENNEFRINQAIENALAYRKDGEDQLANAAMMEAVTYLEQRKGIIGDMAFPNTMKGISDARAAYTLKFGDLGKKIRKLESEGKWDFMEWSDRANLNDLKDAWEEHEERETTVVMDAISKEMRIQESKTRRAKGLGINPEPIDISTSPNTSGAILSETNDAMGIIRSETNSTVINTPTTTSTTNNTTNNTVTGKGDSRMDEIAFNNERASERNNSIF